jgi:uncharacterized protein (DUF608 family)
MSGYEWGGEGSLTMDAVSGATGATGVAPQKTQLPKTFPDGWFKSLYERGAATVYSKSLGELRYIGMPAGGINAGGVYLGGDGRLWLWDVFNDNREGIEPKFAKWTQQTTHAKNVRSRDGACYIEPAHDIRPLEQGFAVRIEYDGKSINRRLAESDWQEITFEAGYPVGTVRYTDPSLPLEITLRAFAPFIPLNDDDSSLPAVIHAFEFRNTGSKPLKISIVGWLENKTGLNTATPTNYNYRRINTVVGADGLTAVHETLLSYDKKDAENKRPDAGDMCIAALADSATEGNASTDLNQLFEAEATKEADKPTLERLFGSVRQSLTLDAGKTATANFVISWYFPNLKIGGLRTGSEGQYYSAKYKSSLEVAQYIRQNFNRLSSQTLLWAETWKDSTLPHWFLERTFVTLDTLATSNAHRFSDGRFWAWEGVGACAGTCTHVWSYAQAMGRIFPALERDLRERTDFGVAIRDDGGIIFRAEHERRPAIDGQAGVILRSLREHQMSADDGFLRRNWEKIRRATQFIINQDKNGDGMEDTPLENTLDAVWEGEIAWLVGICIAAVKAAETMATEAGDEEFARVCADYVRKGVANMDKYLYNGEYYIHRPGKNGRVKLGSYNTCHIDQLYGQSWAYQVGLGRLFDARKVRSALTALWKYNFTTDVGPYIAEHQGGRPYAVAGEGGMIMNTNPLNEEKPYGDNVTWQGGYFHECMSGFEYQVAAHFISEGMLDEGFALVRAIHDRYHAAKRNPYNEIECSDHYARAMASYGAFIAACGFEYHGPKGYMRFAPRLGADDFRAPFTAAEGWGTYAQKYDGKSLVCTLAVKYGKLRLQEFEADLPKGLKAKQVTADGADITWQARNGKDNGVANARTVLVKFAAPKIIGAGEAVVVRVQ